MYMYIMYYIIVLVHVHVYYVLYFYRETQFDKIDKLFRRQLAVPLIGT